MPVAMVKALLIGLLKINNCPLFILLYYTKSSSLAIFYKDNGTWLSVLFLEVIVFHLSCYSKVRGKGMIIGMSVISECLALFYKSYYTSVDVNK